MDRLPNNVLVQILLYLKPRERIKLERVCGIWSDIMPYHDIQKIDLVKALILQNRRKYMDTFPFSRAFEAVILRVRDRLQSVSFGQGYQILITPTIINFLSQYCPNLKDLDISFCKVTENIVAPLDQLSDRLMSLNLGNVIFSVTNIAEHVDNMCILFSHMSQLNRVWLQGTYMHHLSAIRYFPESVTAINLNNCGPLRQDVLLDFLIDRNLKELRLSAYNGMEETIFEVICSLKSLEILELSHYAFLELIGRHGSHRLNYENLGRLKSLEELYVQFNNGFTYDALKSLVRNCSKLRVLNLSNCRHLADYSALSQAENLNTLKIGATEAFDDEILQSIAQSNRKLVNAHFNACGITDLGLQELIDTNSETLQEICVNHCTGISDISVAIAISNCPNLCLMEAQSADVSDFAIETIANSLRFWKSKSFRADFSFCNKITDNGIQTLVQALEATPDFHGSITLHLHQTKVTKAFLLSFVNPKLDISL